MAKNTQMGRRGRIKNALILVGGAVTVVGILGLISLMAGYLPESSVALGGESGFRVIGGLAVLGCMIAGVGFIGE